jgi:hypothetical protein
MAPASDIWSSWNGKAEVTAELEAGKTYLVRYQRTAVDAFRTLITPFPDFDAVDQTTQICVQARPPMPESRVHQ